jgi:tetratricopeptide (TPR) repeat protein
MYTVTFYSYRGGVGRTTALVNVANDLARRGRKVLLVDFDLEAPGLPMRSEEGAHLGLVEFIAEYLRSGKAPDIRNHVYQAKPIDKNCAEIWVMPAGRAHDDRGDRGDDDYWRALHGINWKELYDLQDGFVLFEDLKFQWRESLHPDYVLIDARAGINDRLAICTRQLPDAVIMMFTPLGGEDEPEQRVMRDIIAESTQSSPPRIDLLTVVSMVPPELEGEDFWVGIRYYTDDDEDYSAWGFDPAAAIPLAPELLGGGSWFGGEEKPIRYPYQLLFDSGPSVVSSVPRNKRLPRAYRRLANALIRSNCAQEREGAQAFLKDLQLHPEQVLAILPNEYESEYVTRLSDRTAKLDQVISNFDHDPEILAQAASCLFLARRYDRAMETLDRAIEIAPPSDSILWQRASYRRRLGLPGAVDDLLRLLEARTPEHSILSTARQGLKRRDPQSPELDTTPLNTADPLEPGFNSWEAGFAGINPYVASAFQRLRQLTPEKEQEALRKPRVQQLSPEARQALVANNTFAAWETHQLFRCGKWQALITRLGPRVAPPSSTPVLDSFWDLFYLAMAYWGCGNDARSIAVCQSARELILEESDPASMVQNFGVDDLQEIPLWSLIFWRAGDASTARELLDRCDELLAKVPDGYFFSYWRFCSVKRDLFQEDCESLRKMIQGVKIRPFFLGKVLS